MLLKISIYVYHNIDEGIKLISNGKVNSTQLTHSKSISSIKNISVRNTQSNMHKGNSRYKDNREIPTHKFGIYEMKIYL